MIEISIVVEGQQGLTWPRWKRIVETADGSPLAGLYRSDHFTEPKPPDSDSLETVVSLSYLAVESSRIRFGPLVAPLSFRDPRILVRQAAALDDLSGGRMVLGLGAGWQEREHDVWGYRLGDMRTRMDRLEEGLEIMTRLLSSEQPVSFEGRFFQIRNATLLPRPQRLGGPPILVGGAGPKRTLPMVARYADIWNSLRSSPDEFRARSARLDELAKAEGRDPSTIRRTLFTGVFFARDSAELDLLLKRTRSQTPSYNSLSPREVYEALRARNTIVGTPEMIREQIAPFEAAGVEELMLRWTELDDVESLKAFADTVGA